MSRTLLLRRLAVLAILAAPALPGCSGGGTTVDTAPTAPPITKESGEDLAKNINANRGPMGPGGVPKK